MRRFRRLALGLLVALGVAFLLVRRPFERPAWLGGGGPPNLLIVTLDTLRADHVGSYGYAAARTPHFDALAARGVRFASAASVTPLTLPAHASLFTGTFPAFHGVRDNGGYYLADSHETLAELLRARGFRTGAFVSAFVLDSRWGIGQGFEHYADDFELPRSEKAVGMDAIQRPGGETVDSALRWLAEERDKPFFLWVHLYDPHTPYTPPREYAELFPRTLVGAYDAEIAATDAQLGRLVEALRADGRLGRTLLAVLADHGEMLGEHGEATHGFFIYDAAIRIPMVLAGLGLPARVVDEQVRIVDVMPTALELLGVPAPKAAQGVSLLPATRGERMGLLAVAESWYPRFHYGWSELFAVQDQRYKLIRAPRRELFDLSRDPREQNDLAAGDKARVETLERALDELLARVSSGDGPALAEKVDAATAQALQALGYVGSGVSARHLEERPRGDPKDKIHLYNALKQASTASAEGELDAAAALLREALAEDPEILEGHTLLGNVLVKGKQYDAAVASYRRALALDPEHRESVFRLALAYKESGRHGDARVGFERALSMDAKNGRAMLQLADLDMREQKFEAAEARLRRALEGEVERARFLLKLGECLIEMKRWDDAQKTLAEAAADDPKLETVHFNLALVHEERGDVERAIAAYEKELQVHQKAYRAAFNLAKLLQRRGRVREAVALYRQAVEQASDFAVGRLYLAKALLDVGDLAGAEREARAGLSGKPDAQLAPLGHYVLADVFNRLGRYREAHAAQAAGDRLARAGAPPSRLR